MNLADAIRSAALARGTTPNAEPVTPYLAVNEDADAPGQPELIVNDYAEETAQSVRSMTSHQETYMPEPPAPIVAGGSVVRLELFLAPEQLNSLFRSVVASQHSVMTLREAAGFLRVPTGTLEQMAEDREVPAFQIDNKWRFPRAGLDEWLSLRSIQKEAF